MSLFNNNPRLKSQFLETLLKIVYGPYFERRTNILSKIIDRNCILQKAENAHFTFKGQVYGAAYPGVWQIPKLNPELHAEFIAWLDEHSRVEKDEWPYISNVIIDIMNSSSSMVDWLRIFPECFHAPIKGVLAHLSPAMALSVLSDEEVSTLKQKHAEALQMATSRMMMNLLQS